MINFVRVLGFRSGAVEVLVLNGRSAASVGECCRTFRDPLTQRHFPEERRSRIVFS
jgi:hypothetical protein